METVLAWIVMAVGLVVLLFGVAGGILQMFLEIKKKNQGQSIGMIEFPSAVIDALIRFLEALAKAPLWLALVAIGLFLLIWGASLL